MSDNINMIPTKKGFEDITKQKRILSFSCSARFTAVNIIDTHEIFNLKRAKNGSHLIYTQSTAESDSEEQIVRKLNSLDSGSTSKLVQLVNKTVPFNQLNGP